MEGALVTFSSPANGPSGSFAGGVNTAATNAQGVATAPPFTANGVTGNYSVNASVSGVGVPAAFSLTNVLAPSFTGPFSATFTTGMSQAFPVTVSGFPAATVTVINGTLPSGITFNGNAFAGTPAVGSGGTYSVSLKATNGVAPDATQTFNIQSFSHPLF